MAINIGKPPLTHLALIKDVGFELRRNIDFWQG
jgi:hypothetical protein